MPLTVAVELPDSDRAELARWLRAPSMPAGLAQRARIVLLAADGVGTNEIVTRTGVSKPTVIAWRKRYAAEGIGGLEDRPKPGRPAQVDEVAVVLATLEPPPEQLGVTHWSSRLLAGELGISNVWVARIWRKWGLQPWRRETFKFSTDPQLEAKVRDVVGLYLNPPEKAVVLCVDEKSPDPGPGPDRADPADAARACRRRPPTTTSATAPPPCSPRWRSPPARSPTPATPGTATRSSCASSSRSPRPTRGSNCTSSPTTTPPTSTRPCRPGWPRTRGSPCTSPRPPGPG